MSLFQVYVDAPEREDRCPVGRIDGTDTGRAPFQTQADVLEHERHPDRRDERRQARRVAQPPVGDELDRHVDRAAEDHREHEHRDDEEPEA